MAGLVPYDGVEQKGIVTIHPALTAVFVLCGVIGIVFSGACLIFNFIHRNTK